jgi:hypothetical protein
MENERYIIVGDESQCPRCFVFFTSEPQKVYCSDVCKQAAEDEIVLARIEFQKLTSGVV